MGYWLEVEIEGFKVYVEDLVRVREEIEMKSGGLVLVKYSTIGSIEEKDPFEVLEGWIESIEKIVEKNKDKLKKMGIKYLVLMTLGDIYRYKPKLFVDVGMFLALYKRKPKFLKENVRPYP